MYIYSVKAKYALKLTHRYNYVHMEQIKRQLLFTYEALEPYTIEHPHNLGQAAEGRPFEVLRYFTVPPARVSECWVNTSPPQD